MQLWQLPQGQQEGGVVTVIGALGVRGHHFPWQQHMQQLSKHCSLHCGVCASLVAASPKDAAEERMCPGVVFAQVSFVMGTAAESACLWCSITLWVFGVLGRFPWADMLLRCGSLMPLKQKLQTAFCAEAR